MASEEKGPILDLIKRAARNRAINKARRIGKRKYLGQKQVQRKKRRAFVKEQKGKGRGRPGGGLFEILP
tara:strand:+ start:271 stop:477 length:207 start_codon:yes stop_codon:yes gene_type:complete